MPFSYCCNTLFLVENGKKNRGTSKTPRDTSVLYGIYYGGRNVNAAHARPRPQIKQLKTVNTLTLEPHTVLPVPQFLGVPQFFFPFSALRQATSPPHSHGCPPVACAVGRHPPTTELQDLFQTRRGAPSPQFFFQKTIFPMLAFFFLCSHRDPRYFPPNPPARASPPLLCRNLRRRGND